MASPSGSGHGKGRGNNAKKDDTKLPGKGPSAPNPVTNIWQQPLAQRVKQGPTVALPKPFPAHSPGSSTVKDNATAPANSSPKGKGSSSQAAVSASGAPASTPIQFPALATSASATASSTKPVTNNALAGFGSSSDGATQPPSSSEEAHNTKHANLEPEKAPVVSADQKAAGERGAKIKVRTNMIRLTISEKLKDFYVYSFSFPPISGRELKNRGVKKSLIQAVLGHQPFSTELASIATDWNTLLISTVDLSSNDSALTSGSTKHVNVNWQNQNSTTAETKIIEIALVHVLPVKDLIDYWRGQGNTNVAPHLAALNVLVRKMALHRNPPLNQIVKVGRDKFFWQVSNLPASQWASGLEPREGFFSSALAVTDGIAVNIHNVTGAFITQQRLLDYVQKQRINLGRTGYLQNTSLFKSVTNQLQVRLRYKPPKSINSPRGSLLPNPCHGGHLRRVNGFGRSARVESFYHDDLKQNISVEDYYNKYVLQPQDRLVYSDLIVINVGSRDHPAWVPPELLYIEPHQPLRGRLDETDMASMLKVAQKSPFDNARLVETAVNGPMFNRLDPQWTGIKLNMNSSMMEPDARMLTIQPLIYGRNNSTSERDNLKGGKWNLRGRSFHTPANLNVLGVIEIGDEAGTSFYEPLARGLTQYGITSQGGRQRAVETSKANDCSAVALRNAYRGLSQAVKDSGIILIAMPGSRAEKLYDEYASIKSFFDTDIGLHTVCVTGGKLDKLSNAAFQANLALKFNVKLGGINHTMSALGLQMLQSKGGSTMVVGADVTHPGVGAVPHCPSIASVVATCDRSAAIYPGSMRLQRSKQEQIVDLKDMMVERLAHWARRNNGNLPTDILFFRDGVSDSQFEMVQSHELPKVREGCDQAGRDHHKAEYHPSITLITCGKRHHTRFYAPQNPSRETKKFLDSDHRDNFYPGLVVDDPAIRNPYTFDFFLQSHSALKGTARPCHYFVIQNESNWTSNDLQAITFSLCWVFATALTPISYAAPAYYADRLCERGRRYLWPLLKKHHPHRPQDDHMIAGFQYPAVGHATEEELHDHALDLVKRNAVVGFKGWPAESQNRQNPYHDAVKDVMFYV